MRGLIAGVVAALVVAGVAIALVGGKDDPAGTVRDYLDDANAIQARAQPAFADADRAYIEFSNGTLPVDTGAERLRRAEAAIRRTRAQLAALDPPDSARALHTKLLRVYDLDLGLARETTALVTYPPRFERALGPLPGAQRKLSRAVRGSGTPEEQAAAFEAYAAALAGIVPDLEALRPPALLAASQAGQVRRLRSARALALELRRAVLAKDDARVARLLQRFRKVAAAKPAGALPEKALGAYNARYRAIGLATADVRREQARLQQSLR